jgi:hypothetical protein
MNKHLYHLSDRELKEISTYRERNKGKKLKYDQMDGISFFLAPLTEKDVKDLKREGFKPYRVMLTPYLHRIDLTDKSTAANIESITLESTPEQTEYDDKHWDPKNSKLSIGKYKKEYMLKRNTYLNKLGVRDMTLKEYIASGYVKELRKKYPSYIQHNLKKGNLLQYATYIPHVVVIMKDDKISVDAVSMIKY